MRLIFSLCLILSPIVHASSLTQVQKTKELRFSLTGQYPPFNFVDEKNQLTGFDIEIGNEIAKRIGVIGKPITIAWDGIIAGLLAKKYDVICGSMAITPERLKSIDFSDPYYRSGAQLFVKKGSPLKNIGELKGKNVGVTLGTTYEAWVRKNLKGAKIKTYKGGPPEMILETISGRIDGFITDKIVGTLAIQKKKAPIQRVGSLLYEEKIGIALRKGSEKLKTAINEALLEIKKDGTYKKLSLKWVGIDIR